MMSQPRKFRPHLALVGVTCLAALAGSPTVRAGEALPPIAVAMAAPVGAAPSAAARSAVPAAGLATYRQPLESRPIHHPLELTLTPAPVKLTKSLQTAPPLKRPPESESQNALKGHGTADFADADIEYKWQIKGSKLKVMIPF